ncbi:MAG TPA: large-conductance mechanosensitive channel protein MscL [Paludibacter sp.]|nr:large-conductance mechanosensitive channel protein MscL [Paludibacter sp.]
MGLLNEFKAFAMRGNVVDLAVGVIIGAAFGKIVSSLVADIIMPPLGLLIGGVNFTDLKWVLKVPRLIGNGVRQQPDVAINYGNFLQATFDFLIVAFAVFVFIRLINRLNRKQGVPPAPEPSNEEKLLAEIRDLLKNR